MPITINLTFIFSHYSFNGKFNGIKLSTSIINLPHLVSALFTLFTFSPRMCEVRKSGLVMLAEVEIEA